MKFALVALCVALALCVSLASAEEKKILKRVIKSTPTATNLGRIRTVVVRSPSPEKGQVSEISSKEAASFGMRSNATQTGALATAPQAPAVKAAKLSPTTTSTTTTTTTQPSTTAAVVSSTSAPFSTTSTQAAPTKQHQKPQQSKNRASDRQQAAEVELLSSAPSSWQTMTAVEAPAAMLIAAGARAPQPVASADLSSSASEDFLRSDSKTSYSSSQQSRQQSKQSSFFYPQSGKTSKTNSATKTPWYAQPSSTTPRPAPVIQERYEQQEQYVEQQQHYEAAPPGQAEPFAFDFNTRDSSGNGQYRKEESDNNGVVRGSYGYTDAAGTYRHVDYVADKDGFRAKIRSNEPGLIGETQPASIQLAGGAPPARLSEPAPAIDTSGDWSAASENLSASPDAGIASAPPDFESSHKSERLRAPRHFRN